jgi:hypothetical protein
MDFDTSISAIVYHNLILMQDFNAISMLCNEPHSLFEVEQSFV